jgi:hypothetical protein
VIVSFFAHISFLNKLHTPIQVELPNFADMIVRVNQSTFFMSTKTFLFLSSILFVNGGLSGPNRLVP